MLYFNWKEGQINIHFIYNTLKYLIVMYSWILERKKK